MIKRLLIGLLTLLTLTLDSYGQNKPKSKRNVKNETQANNLVGTWRLIEFTDLDSLTGKWEHRYGKHPKGYFTYTKNNIVNLNISCETPLIISEDSAKNYSINYYKLINNYSLGYFGTYSVDFKKSVVTHYVKGGSLPWYIDTEQPRPFILKGDTLIIGDNIKWRRTLVRED